MRPKNRDAIMVPEIFGFLLFILTVLFCIPCEIAGEEPYEDSLLNLINTERVTSGGQPFVIDSQLVKIARTHTDEMFELKYLNSISPVSGTALDRTQEAMVFDYHSVAFVAKAPSVEALYRKFMEDSACAAEILNEGNTHIGIAIRVNTEEEKISTLHITRRFVEIDPLFTAEGYLIYGTTNRSIVVYTATGKSKMKLLKFEIYTGFDFMDKTNLYLSQELTTNEDSTYTIKFEGYPKENYCIVIWAKQTQDGEDKPEVFIKGEYK